jgi:hypothetical protein
LVDLTIFTAHNRLVLYILLIALSAYTAISGWVYNTAIWYQSYKHESPIENVAHVSAAPIMGMAVCLIVPYLAPRAKAPVILFAGGFFTA